jgi:hypothetical protein
MDDQTLETLALYANGTRVAFAILNKCLQNNNALRPGQFSAALKATFNDAEADWLRLDYQYLKELAKLVDQFDVHYGRENE